MSDKQKEKGKFEINFETGSWIWNATNIIMQ